MRVLIFTNIYPSNSFPTSGVWLAEQVRSLRDRQLEVRVISFDSRGLHLAYGLVIPELVSAIRSRRWDIIHTHHTYTILLAHTARKLAGSKIPLVGTIHEQEAMDRSRISLTWKPTDQLRHSIAFKRLAIQKADASILVSQELAAAIRPARSFEVIPCGVDLSRFIPMDREACRAKLRINPDAFVIFWPSDPRIKRKREELARMCHQIVHKSIVGSTLIIGGSIEPTEMPYYYNAADVILQTSALEVSPTIVKEALACEIPLVSTRAGDTKIVCGGLPNCFVLDDNPSMLAEAILACRGKRLEGGRERVRSLELDLDQVAGRLINLYQRILPNSSAVQILL